MRCHRQFLENSFSGRLQTLRPFTLAKHSMLVSDRAQVYCVYTWPSRNARELRSALIWARAERPSYSTVICRLEVWQADDAFWAMTSNFRYWIPVKTTVHSHAMTVTVYIVTLWNMDVQWHSNGDKVFVRKIFAFYTLLFRPCFSTEENYCLFWDFCFTPVTMWQWRFILLPCEIRICYDILMGILCLSEQSSCFLHCFLDLSSLLKIIACSETFILHLLRAYI